MTREDIEKLSFNTAISQMMICTNAFTGAEVKPAAAIVTFLKVLSPFAPHLAEELNAQIRAKFPNLAAKRLLSDETWPAYDPAALIEDEVEVVFQVNGKLRGRVHRYQGVPLVVTYHPAYLLRNPADKAKAWADLCLALQTAQQG